jgi:hypothetical protein
VAGTRYSLVKGERIVRSVPTTQLRASDRCRCPSSCSAPRNPVSTAPRCGTKPTSSAATLLAFLSSPRPLRWAPSLFSPSCLWAGHPAMRAPESFGPPKVTAWTNFFACRCRRGLPACARLRARQARAKGRAGQREGTDHSHSHHQQWPDRAGSRPGGTGHPPPTRAGRPPAAQRPTPVE